jgi:two-component system cell cycle sensor histidine kinase PleC
MYRVMVDRMQGGLFMVEGKQFTFVNPALAELVGFKVAELEGLPYHKIFAPGSLAKIEGFRQRRDAGEDVPDSYESVCLHKDGVTKIPVIMNIELVTLENGRVVRVGTITDITERVRAESALRASERLLSEAQRIGRIGHWRVDPKTHKIECSDVFYEIYGWDRAHVTPTLERAVASIHPDDRTQINMLRNTAVERREPYKFVTRIIRPDGEIRFLRGEGEPVFDETGQLKSIFGVSQDITEQRKIEQELVRERHRAVSASNAKSEFLATISHEIRTPLNAILGFAEIMEKNIFGPLGDEKYTEYVHDIRDSAVHLLDLVGDILDTSAIESGEFSLSHSSFDIEAVMRECLKLMRVQALDARIELAVNCPGDLPPLYADRLAIKQIVINLLANAVKFTPEDGHIDIDVSATRDTMLISVTDTGIGIPEDVLPNVVLPFDRGRQNPLESKEGTGLGLAIVNSLVTLHDGRFEIESVVGVGTQVRIWLPFDNSAAA